MASFLFLNPIEPYFRHEIRKSCGTIPDRPEVEAAWRERFESHGHSSEVYEAFYDEREPFFRQFYAESMQAAIGARYRDRGFRVHYSRFPDTPVSSVFGPQPEDVDHTYGLTIVEHETLQPDGSHRYPNFSELIERVNDDHIVIAGFHMTDCVVRALFAAWDLGVNASLDDDLTDHFVTHLRNFDFQFDATAAIPLWVRNFVPGYNDFESRMLWGTGVGLFE